MLSLKKATIKTYDAASHTASVQIAGSLTVWLDALAVATDIPPREVQAGRECAVLFFAEENPADAVIVAVYGANPSVAPNRRVEDADADTSIDTESNTDEDKVRVSAGGVERLLVQTASPHVSVAGDLSATGSVTLGAQAQTLDTPASGVLSVSGDLRVAGNDIQDSTGAARLSFQGGVANIHIPGTVYFPNNVAINQYVDTNIRVRIYDSTPNPSQARTGLDSNQWLTYDANGGDLEHAGMKGVVSVQINGGAGVVVPQAQGVIYRAGLGTTSGVSGTVTSARGVRAGLAYTPAASTTISGTDHAALYAESPSKSGGSIAVTRLMGLHVANPGLSGVTTAIAIRADNVSGATNNYLLELGPTTPYLRLLGGAAPGANLTNLYLAEGAGPTLRRVQWKLFSAMAAGDRVMVLV